MALTADQLDRIKAPTLLVFANDDPLGQHRSVAAWPTSWSMPNFKPLAVGFTPHIAPVELCRPRGVQDWLP
jgi:hypothetical protein